MSRRFLVWLRAISIVLELVVSFMVLNSSCGLVESGVADVGDTLPIGIALILMIFIVGSILLVYIGRLLSFRE